MAICGGLVILDHDEGAEHETTHCLGMAMSFMSFIGWPPIHRFVAISE